MADYVLVHGGNMTTETWNRLSRGTPVHTPDGTMGGKIWDPVIPALEHQSHRVFAPTLHDEHTSTLTGHIEQVCGIITSHDLKDVILAGHSYGGMVITGAAAAMPDRIRHLVYIDAALPDPGQSLFDIITSGGCDPRSFTGLEPAPPYVEKLDFDARTLQRLEKTYILCTKSEFSAVTEVARKKITVLKDGWTYREMPASHVPMAEMPDEVAQILLDVAEK
jgi:pimeloyl-ACP methyl ester carboxylesterase